MLLEVLWLTVLGINIVPFGAYILYMRRIAERKPWNIRLDPTYEPSVSILIRARYRVAYGDLQVMSVIEIIFIIILSLFLWSLRRISSLIYYSSKPRRMDKRGK